MPHISGAHQAGMLSVTGTSSAFVPRTLDNTTAAIACQWKYYQQGVLGGVKLKLGFEKQAQKQTQTQTQTQNHHHRAPKIAHPTPYKGDRTEFSNFIMQLHLVFNSDPPRYSNDA